MSIPGSALPLLLTSAAGAAGYEIERSLRFNADDQPYLERSGFSGGDNKKWTLSFWFKNTLQSSSVRKQIFCVETTGRVLSVVNIRSTDGALEVFHYNGTSLDFQVLSAPLFRDPSAWYHFVIAYDTTISSPASDRVKLFANGIQITNFQVATYPSLNFVAQWNTNSLPHRIGENDTRYLGGYLAEMHFIDGQQLAATDFGEFDTNNVWQPIAYTGSYGTTGFHLDFSDNSSASALGTDSSGNGNDWTVNNIYPGSSNTTIWSNYVTSSTGSFLGGFGPTSLFDATIASSCDTDPKGGTITFTPPSSISYSSSVEVYQGSSAAYYNLNGGSDISVSAGGWSTLASGSGSITSIAQRAQSASDYNNWGAIRVDGVVLYDPSVAGPQTDSLFDSPTNGTQTDTGAGGEVSGNYCTWNPLSKTSGITLANGNLDVNGDNADYHRAYGTIAMKSGKWYWEMTCGTLSTYNQAFLGISVPGDYFIGYGYYSDNGSKYQQGTASTFGATFTAGDVVGIAFDADNGKIWFSKNGTWQASGDPATGTNPAFSSIPTADYFPAITIAGGTIYSANFGQRAFAYTAPSGFKALCTANLDDPTIADGSTAMDAITYAGTSATNQVAIPGGFSPDLVWIKQRDGATSHALYDIIRGSTAALSSDSTVAERDLGSNNSVTFGSDSFTLGADSAGWTNYNTRNYVAWTWDGGSSTVANTDGSISSSVRANASAGFSIVSFTSTNTNNATVGHGLGVAPKLVIIKNRDASELWWVLHEGMKPGANPWNNYTLSFNSTDGTSGAYGTCNGTAPTSSVVTLSNITNPAPNYGTDDKIMYCWAPVEGYSAFGSFTGNGSTDGPFVYTGMRPRFIIFKCASVGGDWWNFIDTARATYNPVGPYLESGSQAESSASVFDVLSNGFKPRFGTGNQWNGSGQNYVYMAWAESPFKYARAR